MVAIFIIMKILLHNADYVYYVQGDCARKEKIFFKSFKTYRKRIEKILFFVKYVKKK